MRRTLVCALFAAMGAARSEIGEVVIAGQPPRKSVKLLVSKQ